MRILIYSHDTFGLGHLRRSRTIALALVDRFPDAEVAIITGSPFAGTFDYADNIIYLQIPPVTKRTDGSYASMEEGVELDYTVDLRARAITDFVVNWNPELLIVDKEPLGFRHELMEALQIAKKNGTRTVLGLRDVLDAPEIMQTEWERKNVFQYLDVFYDEVWVYGPESFYDPLQGLSVSQSLYSKVVFTGFLDRRRDKFPKKNENRLKHGFDNYILVTVGGGGDGFQLLKSTIKMVKHQENHNNFLMVLGPFMGTEENEILRNEAESISNIKVFDFDPWMEDLIEDSEAVIGMCGYNTFCEVLTFDKVAMFIPRSIPRLEQQIRSYRAASFGWASVLESTEASNAEIFNQATRSLLSRKPPSSAPVKPDLGGLEVITSRVEALLAQEQYSADILSIG